MAARGRAPLWPELPPQSLPPDAFVWGTGCCFFLDRQRPPSLTVIRSGLLWGPLGVTWCTRRWPPLSLRGLPFLVPSSPPRPRAPSRFPRRCARRPHGAAAVAASTAAALPPRSTQQNEPVHQRTRKPMPDIISRQEGSPRELAARSWQLAARLRQLAARSWQLAARPRQLADPGSWQLLDPGSWQRDSGSCRQSAKTRPRVAEKLQAAAGN